MFMLRWYTQLRGYFICKQAATADHLRFRPFIQAICRLFRRFVSVQRTGLLRISCRVVVDAKKHVKLTL